MIIGFCGRLRSGKSELARECVRHGYQKLSFAIPLKRLCADILDTSIDELNKAKNNGIEISLTIGKDICQIIADETEIPFDTVYEKCNGKTIETVRELLQFIGTDLIREYNKDWHVNRLREMIDIDKDYVFDDVRFQNEKKMIEDLGGDCWFVIRPTFENISNHESETSITWNDCYNKIIINDSTLPYLLFKWEIFLDNYKKSCAIRDENFNRILENGIKDLEKDSISDMMFLPMTMFTYRPIEYDKNKIDTITMSDSKAVFITYKDGTVEVVDNPLSIENIKMLL